MRVRVSLEGVLLFTFAGLVAIAATPILMPRYRGFVAACLWSIFPIYGVFLPPGGGLIFLISALTLTAAIIGLRQASIRSWGLSALPAILLGLFVLIRVSVISAPTEVAIQLLAAVLAAGLLGWVASALHWGEGFPAGLVVGGVILAGGEVLRVLQGGKIHAAEVAFGLNPIVLAQYASIAALVVFYQVNRGSWRNWTLIFAGIAIAGIIVSNSRGPLLGFIAACFYLFLLLPFFSRGWLRGIFRSLITLFIVTLVIIVFVLLGTDLGSWFRIDDADGNAGSRVSAWQGAIATIIDFPLWGAGPGNYFNGVQGINYGMPEYPHNIWLESWSEYGVLAFVLLTFATILTFVKASARGAVFAVFGLIAFSFSGSLWLSVVFWTTVFLSLSTRHSAKQSFGDELNSDHLLLKEKANNGN